MTTEQTSRERFEAWYLLMYGHSEASRNQLKANINIVKYMYHAFQYAEAGMQARIEELEAKLKEDQTLIIHRWLEKHIAAIEGEVK